MAQQATSQQLAQPLAAAPPTKSEIERKLSFKSAPHPKGPSDSPKKTKKPHAGYPGLSGNESDSSSITSSNFPATIGSPNPNLNYPASPLLTPTTTSVGGLSAIAERNRLGPGDELGEMELEDVEEEAEEGEVESGSEDEAELEGQLERGMEGERVVKSGYLAKKQERRKAWKKRWFVLRTGKLAYYKDEKEYSLKRVIDLHEVHTVAPVTVKKQPYTFGIVTPKRSFFARASSADDMDEWVRAINGVRRRLSEREEEERMKREKGETSKPAATGSSSMPIPPRDRSHLESIDTSPAATSGSFFVNRAASSPQQMSAPAGMSPNLAGGAIISPSSPLDTANSLTARMAEMSFPRTPSAQSAASTFAISPRLPSGGIASIPSSRVVSGITVRRDPSASSTSSTADHFPRSPQVGGQPAPAASSEDEDEPEGYFPDTSSQPPPAPVDPNKVILSAYLMKRDNGRGRKIWRKRWFYLTSQGLTYTKSHMDTRALRFIPLSSVLDALEVDPSFSAESDSDSDNPASGHGHSFSQSPSTRQYQPSVRGRLASGSGAGPSGQHEGGHGHMHGHHMGLGHGHPHNKGDVQGAGSSQSHTTGGGGGGADEHIFRLITAKRTFVLCAPSEEDEIKWLAAFRALLNRERGVAGQGNVPTSPIMTQAPKILAGPPSAAPGPVIPVPTITQQPPTPASLPPNLPNNQFQQTQSPPITPMSGESFATIGRGEPPVLSPPLPMTTGQSGSGSGSAIPMTAAALAGTGNTPPGMTRNRSATYTAKSAVADAVRRFHPEKESLGR